MEELLKIADPLRDHVMSVSSLNLFAESPAAYREHILNPVRTEASYFSKGSAVDCLITEPEKFNDDFIVIKTARPSGMLGDLCKIMNQYNQANTENLPEETLFSLAYRKVGFKLKEESVWKKYQKPEIQTYMKFLKNSKGKTVLTQYENDQVRDVVGQLQNSKETRFYMKDCMADFNIEVYDQLEIRFEYNGMKCKGFMDRVLINHTTKEITPIDLKTTGKSVFEFRNSFIKFGYFRQAAFYYEGVKTWINSLPPHNNIEMKDYKLNDFLFVVAEMECLNLPVVYKCTTNDLDVGKYGGELLNGAKIKGFSELLEEVKWHRETDIWNIKAEHAQAYKEIGAVELNIFKQLKK